MSNKIILDKRDSKESFVGFVWSPKRKNTDFSNFFFTLLETTQIPPKLVINMKAKTKDRRTWISLMTLVKKFQNLSTL